MVRESRIIADLLISGASPDEWNRYVMVDNLLQKRSAASAKRNAQAIRKRLDSKKKQGSIKKNRGKVDDY